MSTPYPYLIRKTIKKENLLEGKLLPRIMSLSKGSVKFQTLDKMAELPVNISKGTWLPSSLNLSVPTYYKLWLAYLTLYPELPTPGAWLPFPLRLFPI